MRGRDPGHESNDETFLRISLTDEWTARRFAGLVRDIEYVHRYLGGLYSEGLVTALSTVTLGDRDAKTRGRRISEFASDIANAERDSHPLRVSSIRLASPGLAEFRGA